MDDEEQKNVILLLIHNKIHSSIGNAFQELFSDIAEAMWGHEFERRRPQGNLGDFKCDGYHAKQKCVFQCYGPINLEGKKTKDKIVEDFNGAAKFFGPNMEKWVFVHNEFEGLPTEAHHTVIELRAKHPHVDIQIWGPKQIMGVVSNADVKALKQVVPFYPLPKSIRHFLYEDLDAIVSHIGGLDPKPSQVITVPSREKLDHNSLSDYIEAQLRYGQIVAAQIEEYFRETSRAERGERIAELFRREYRDCKLKKQQPDTIFHRLIDLAGGLDRSTNQIAAVIGLVAYFFHSCDIFENPPTISGNQS